MSFLPLRPLPSYSNSRGFRLNNTGVVVGASFRYASQGPAPIDPAIEVVPMATIWEQTIPRAVGRSGWSSVAVDINDSGDILMVEYAFTVVNPDGEGGSPPSFKLDARWFHRNDQQESELADFRWDGPASIAWEQGNPLPTVLLWEKPYLNNRREVFGRRRSDGQLIVVNLRDGTVRPVAAPDSRWPRPVGLDDGGRLLVTGAGGIVHWRGPSDSAWRMGLVSPSVAGPTGSAPAYLSRVKLARSGIVLGFAAASEQSGNFRPAYIDLNERAPSLRSLPIADLYLPEQQDGSWWPSAAVARNQIFGTVMYFGNRYEPPYGSISYQRLALVHWNRTRGPSPELLADPDPGHAIWYIDDANDAGRLLVAGMGGPTQERGWVGVPTARPPLPDAPRFLPPGPVFDWPYPLTRLLDAEVWRALSTERRDLIVASLVGELGDRFSDDGMKRLARRTELDLLERALGVLRKRSGPSRGGSKKPSAAKRSLRTGAARQGGRRRPTSPNP